MKFLRWAIKIIETHVWPWKVFSVLRRERDTAQAALREGRWNYVAGLNEHRSKWLMIANAQWAERPFEHGELVAMIHLYNEGMTPKEAVNMLYIYSGRHTNGYFTS